MTAHSPSCPVSIAQQVILARATTTCRRCAARRMLHGLDDAEDKQPAGLFLDIQRDVPEMSLLEISDVWDSIIAACDEMLLEPHTCLEKGN